MIEQALAVRDAADALAILSGRVWHSTSPARWAMCRDAGLIMAVPPLPDSERLGRADMPGYVRWLGGVSLFDLRGFDPDAYDARCPSSNWRYFIPFRRDWGEAVWLEVDIDRCGDRFVSGAELRERWLAGDYMGRLMPVIEGAFLGDLPVANLTRAVHLRPAGG